MTSAELKAKMEAAQAKVEKIKKTIERHEKGAEKKLAVLTKNGGLPNPSLYRGASYDAYWAACEYESKLDDIKTATRKLADAEKVVQNWQAKYEKAQAQIKNHNPRKGTETIPLEGYFQFYFPEH